MLCRGCEIASYLTEDAALPENRGIRAELLKLARTWHKSCLNWRGRNKKGCDCGHVVPCPL